MSRYPYRLLLGACIGLMASAVARGDSLGSAFAGTPPWDEETHTGYHDGEMSGHAVNNSGVAVASAITSIDGFGGMFTTAALRWSAAGCIEMGGLSDGSLLLSAGPTPAAINRDGISVGAAPLVIGYEHYGDRAVRWNAAGVATQLDNPEAPGVEFGTALAINSAGTTVGLSLLRFGDVVEARAVRWDAGTALATALDHLGGSHSAALAINDAGTAVGYSSLSFETPIGTITETFPVRWNAGQTAGVRLQSLGQSSDGAESAIAYGINSSGVIIGNSEQYHGGNESYGNRAVRWLAGGTTPIELETLGSNYGQTTTTANAINDAGTIVGSAERWFGFGSPFPEFYGVAATRWTTSGQVTELGSLGQASDGSIDATALAINTLGIAAGRCEKYVAGEGVGPRAVVWNLDGSALDLNTLGLVTPEDPQGAWVLSQASSLSDTGFVAGSGTYDPDDDGPRAPYGRHFVMLVPQAGTYGRGDATLDAAINFDDLLILAQHYGQPNPGRSVGVADLDLDGMTDFDDLLTLAQHYGSTAAFESDWTLARSLVPEPQVLMLLLVGLASRSRPSAERRSSGAK